MRFLLALVNVMRHVLAATDALAHSREWSSEVLLWC